MPLARVLILHNRYRQPGGEDVVVTAQAKLLRQKGHEVELLEKDNREIDKYTLLHKAVLFFQTAENSAVADQVAMVAKKFKPDTALIHNTLPLFSPSIYAPLKKLGVRVVQYLHNYRLVCPAGTLFRGGKACTLCVDDDLRHAVEYRCWNDSKMATLAVTRMLDRHRRKRTWQNLPDLFVALNGYQRDVLVKSGVIPAEKTVVQPNFIEEPEIAPGENAGEGFIYAGRLSAEKGIQTLLAAHDLKPALPLKIIGEGPLVERPLNPQDKLFNTFLFHRPHREVLTHIAACRALVFPSEWQEPFGLSMVEAMALGRPVIASRVAGPKEIVVDGETGLFFEPGDANALAACMQRLHDDPGLAMRLGNAGRERYQKEFSIESGYRRLLQNLTATN